MTFWQYGLQLLVAELTHSKTMAMSTADLFRLLPKIAQSQFCLSDDCSIVIRSENRTLEIQYHEKQSCKIGAIELPQLQLDFKFFGYFPAEAAAFITKFDTIYRRGGG